MKALLVRFARNESGATAIEYGLLGSLIAVAIIVGATTLGTKLNTTFNAISTKINGPAA
jgi:pilus assembly protein Flp/PilA